MPFPSPDTQTAASGLRRSTSPAGRRGPAFAVAALLSAVLALAACTLGGVTAPQTGTPTPQVGEIVVTVSTAGGPAPTAYAIAVDTQPAQPAPVNGAVVFTALPAGPHEVMLSKVPTNCAVGGVNPRTVSVSVGDTARTTFAVTCTAATTAEVEHAVHITAQRAAEPLHTVGSGIVQLLTDAEERGAARRSVGPVPQHGGGAASSANTASAAASWRAIAAYRVGRYTSSYSFQAPYQSGYGV